VKKPAVLFAFILLISGIIYFFDPAGISANALFQTTFLLLIPLSIALGFGLKFKDVGLAFNKKVLFYSALLILIAIPGMIYGAQLSVFQNYYPRFYAGSSLMFVLSEIALIPYFFSFEFFYRGFSLFLLKKHVGIYWAILLHNIPYFLVHVGKPGLELYYSFFAGLVFAYVSIKAKSFLPAFAGHYITSAIFDYLCW